jgi:NAD(P)-dependent dehydrogenase (short-subunit alcohol dehydrogenase family)
MSGGADDVFSVAGKTAVVTGGARGIGRMIARGFVAAGARVYVTSRSPELCAEVAAELSAPPGDGTCLPLAADLSTEEGCRLLATAVREREPRLDVLVNGAGVMGELWMRTLTQAVWHEVLAVNVQAGFFLIRDLLPLLTAASGDGEPSRVINIGSVDGSTTSDLDLFAYSASKAAVHHLTAHLARRLAPAVTVNALAPGPSETRMTEAVVKVFGESIAQGIPMRRICRAEDLVGTAIFLASRAGSYITGAVVPVDGGASTT